MDTIYKRMDDDTELIKARNEESQIQKFYAGKTIFLTGSTGFMGKALVEKLLRGCPDLKCIYVLIRPKRGISVEERMKIYFNDVIFGPLRKLHPDLESKVRAIEGDLEKADLGLSDEDKNVVIEKTNIIFHNASNVKFNGRISVLGRVNVIGTAETLDLAMKCKNIQGFMYVSTAYSHCYRTEIREEIYESPSDLSVLKNLIIADETISNGINEKDLKNIIGKFPNMYTYTKAVAEGVVSKAAKTAPFPCIIYRPSIVLSSWKEPLAAWIDNLNGPTMGFVGYGVGAIHTGYGTENIVDFIPVDMAINSILVSMWDTVKNRPKSFDAYVYNYGSSTVNPITITAFQKLCLNTDKLNYSVHTIWPRSMRNAKCIWHFYLCHFLYHCIPAVFFDAYLLATGKKPIAITAVKKVTLMFSVLMFFTGKSWMIDTTETIKAIDRMNSIDRDLFFCDTRKLDWADYTLNYWNGLRLYVLKDPLSTVPEGMRRYRRLEYLRNVVYFILLAPIVYFIVTRLSLL